MEFVSHRFSRQSTVCMAQVHFWKADSWLASHIILCLMLHPRDQYCIDKCAPLFSFYVPDWLTTCLLSQYFEIHFSIPCLHPYAPRGLVLIYSQLIMYVNVDLRSGVSETYGFSVFRVDNCSCWRKAVHQNIIFTTNCDCADCKVI